MAFEWFRRPIQIWAFPAVQVDGGAADPELNKGTSPVLKQLRSEEDHKNVIEQGFTLVELLIVIVILGILAGIVVFAVGNLTSNSKQSSCATEAQSFYTAYQAYKAAAKGTSPGTGNNTATTDRDQVIADLTNQAYGGAGTPNATYAGNGPFLQKAPVARTTGYWDDANSYVDGTTVTSATATSGAGSLQAAVDAKATADKQPEWGFIPSSGMIAQSKSAGFVCG